jgi:hypothetical protein
MRVSSVARPLAFALTATALLAGCAAQSSMSPSTTPANQAMPPTQIPMSEGVMPDSTLKVGVRLTGETATTNKHYGKVLGYFKGFKSTTSQVIKLSANSNVVFKNVDTAHPHTASFLGDATNKSAPWPASFNGSSTAAPAGTAIGTSNWSTGTLNPGKQSAVYSTGAPGFYMLGCFYHYDLFGMRTVIIVQ